MSRAVCGRNLLLCLSAFFAVSNVLHAQPSAAVSTPSGSAATIDPVLKRVNEAVEITKLRNLDFQRHTPWQILHGLLALRENYTVKNGPEFVNALDYLSTKARYKGDAWFETTAYGGRAHPYNGTPYDFEGHVNQSLSIIAMCNVPLTHQFKTGDGRTVTMADMVKNAQMSVNSKDELTWTLWYLTHYLDQDTAWTNAQGQQWSMESLVRNQVAASVLTAPCGGTHNLFALAYARNSYMQKHGQLRGAWLEADHKIQQYIATAQAMQNRDGSFATQYFKSRGYSTDFNERIKASGHMLEWLLVALPKSRLNEDWLRSGVQTLANDMIQNASQPADCGPLYHSLHALVLYQQRMKAAQPQTEPNATPVEETVARPDTSELQATPVPPSTPVAPNSSSTTPHVRTTPSTMSPPSTSIVSEKAISEFRLPLETASTASPTEMTSPASIPLVVTQQPTQGTTPSVAPILVPTPRPNPQQTAPRARPRAPDQPRLFRRLSGEDDTSAVTSAPATVEVIEPSRLTPVPGGMPIFKPAAPEAVTPAPTEEVAKTSEPESATKTEEVKSDDSKPASTEPVKSESTDEKAEVTEPEKTEATDSEPAPASE
ncbi:MAG TPA: hypothetical protein VNQ76_08340 [Planctomicrobium sp.]|nr:hypothetical protein [Planctomicrobium sp.]